MEGAGRPGYADCSSKRRRDARKNRSNAVVFVSSGRVSTLSRQRRLVLAASTAAIATVAAPIVALRTRPVLRAPLQARVVRPTKAIALMAPPITPPSRASACAEDGAVNKTSTRSEVRASRVARRRRVSRMAALISAVDRVVPSACRLLRGRFAVSAIPSSRADFLEFLSGQARLADNHLRSDGRTVLRRR